MQDPESLVLSDRSSMAPMKIQSVYEWYQADTVGEQSQAAQKNLIITASSHLKAKKGSTRYRIICQSS